MYYQLLSLLIHLDDYQGHEVCLKIEPESKFFPIGDLSSTTATRFNTVTGVVLESNTYWIDAREGSSTCDLPKGIIDTRSYDIIQNKSIIKILDLWVQFFALLFSTWRISNLNLKVHDFNP